MKNKEKFIQLFFVIVIVAGLATVPMIIGEQRASVSLFFWSADNRNDTVLRAQEKLTELGLYEGRLSGLFGLRTRSAIIRFQEDNNLTVNGILDIPTQNVLFYVPPEIEYLSIPFTDEGNKFLDEWIMSQYGNAGQPIELQGELLLAQQEIFHQDNTWPLEYTLVSGGKVYALGNISDEPIDGFLGQQVSVNGFMLEKENNLGLKSVVVNHLSQI